MSKVIFQNSSASFLGLFASIVAYCFNGVSSYCIGNFLTDNFFF